MKTKICILFLLFFVLQSCEKEDSGSRFSLPPVTQTGENRFGCYIDGRLLVPRDGEGTFGAADRAIIIFDVPGNAYDINVHDFASDRTGSINLHIVGLDSLGIGKYVVNESNCYDGIDSPETTNIFCKVYDYKKGIYKMYCSSENSGIINITRYDHGIISGTFSCVAANKNNPDDIIEITKGRFDINGYTLPYTEFP